MRTNGKIFKQNTWQKAVLHIDADAFFASVEEILNPRLKGNPVIVGGPIAKRGVVSSANYIARQYGVRSAMSMHHALRLCPKAKVVYSGSEFYRDFSNRMFTICEKFTPQVERTSIDEGYLDLSGTEQLHQMTVREIAKSILCKINKELGLSISGGLSVNKTVSKIASALNKPHALTTVMPGEEAKFLAPLPIEKMPGIGRKTAPVLRNFGLTQLGDIAQLSFEEIYKILGTSGVALWKKTRGIDLRRVDSQPKEAKSISNEHTFAEDVIKQDILLHKLKSLCQKVLYHLRKSHRRSHVVNLKIRYSDFKTYTFQQPLISPSDSDFEVFPQLKTLFMRKWKEQSVRLIGCGVSDLRNQYNMSFLENQQKQNLVGLGDQLRQKYGLKIVNFGW